MSSYTIIGVADQVRDWNSTAGGPMKAYRIDLQSADGVVPLVEWSRKASSPAPTQGDVVEGDVEQGQYGLKFKKAQTGGFGSRPEDPQRQKRIVRQHSQSMALQAIGLAFERGLFEPGTEPHDSKALFHLIGTVTDWFDRDVESAAS